MRWTLLAAMLMASAQALAEAPDAIVLTSGWQDGGRIPQRSAARHEAQGCDGGDLSPAVTWSGVPDATRSLVLTVFDTDARRGRGLWHWIVADLPPTVPGLPEGAGRTAPLPAGARLLATDLGDGAYDGPCPPRGETHHYVLELRALDIARLPADATRSELATLFRRHVLAKASLTALYALPGR